MFTITFVNGLKLPCSPIGIIGLPFSKPFLVPSGNINKNSSCFNSFNEIFIACMSAFPLFTGYTPNTFARKRKNILLNNSSFAKTLTGLFSIVTTTTLSNLIIVNSYIKGANAGALAGELGGVNTRISFVNVVIGEEGVPGSVVIDGGTAGGLVGDFSNSVESNFNQCTNFATVNGSSYAGGMIGYAYNAESPKFFLSCTNKGVISGPSATIGGMAGYIRCLECAESTLYDANCTSTTTVKLIGTLSCFD